MIRRTLAAAAAALASPAGCASEPPPDGERPVDCGGAADPDATVGLRLCTDAAASGFTLLAPTRSRSTYLIDAFGRVVRSWESAFTPGLGAVLTDAGTLLRSGRGGVGLSPRFGAQPGAGGVLEEYAWDGERLSAIEIAGPSHYAHHAVRALPGGTALVLVWEAVTEAELVALGRDPTAVPEGGVFMDAVYEVVVATGEVVWRWGVRDHLVQDRDPGLPGYGDPAALPGRIDVNAGRPRIADWTHANGLDLSPDTDLLVVSVRAFDEIWVIDRGLSTAEAAGPQGDILFRWGAPARWGGQGPQELFGQHDPSWIAADRLLVFDNGAGRSDEPYSRLVEVEIPFDGDRPRPLTEGSQPIAPSWTWSAPVPTSLFVEAMGAAQRLPGGGTLVTDSVIGRLLELDPAGAPVWEYVNPVTDEGPVGPGSVPEEGTNAVFAARRYAADSPPLLGRAIEAGEPLVLLP